MSRWSALACAVLTMLVVSGCGDPLLWERWQAERAYEHARRLADRVLVRPSLAPPRHWEQAASAFRDVTTRWPARAWVDRGGRTGREIAAVSARSSLALARLEALRGREAEALAAWRVAGEACAPLPALAAEATAGEARALGRAGRFDEALAAWTHLAEGVPPYDPDAGWIADVLQAPLRAARELRGGGRPEEADALLRRAEARLRGALERERGPKRAPLLGRVADYATARGDLAAALVALRERTAAETERDAVRGAVLAMATTALQLGAPDTALAYARWGEQLGGRAAAQATLVRARAFSAEALTDSALDAYGLLLERPRDPDLLQPAARYERGELFVRLGRWESARAEWRALQAQSPTHPLAFLSMQRIVQHHAAAREPDLARFEARRAIAQLERLLEINADPIVQRQARRVRGELMAEVGDDDSAVEAFADLWDRFPGDSIAEQAGLRAVQLARRSAASAARGESLRRIVASQATRAEVRRAAAELR